MKAINVIIGAAALAFLAGCGDDTYAPSNIQGDAAYCVRSLGLSAPISEIGFYVNVDISSGEGRLVERVSVNAVTPLESAEFFPLHFEGGERRSSLHYIAVADERRILGYVESIEISATDDRENQFTLPLEEVDCVTLDEMISR